MSFADTNSARFPVTDSSGNTHHLIGVYYAADTDMPAPCAIFVHGIPGSEKNHDLAHRLRADGWHVLVMHLSGAWGSEGSYFIPDHPRDVRAALDYVLNPESSARVNPEKIAVMGYSLGSRAALISAVEDSRIGAVVSIAGFCDFSEVILAPDFFEGMPFFLRDATIDNLQAGLAAIGQGLQPGEALAKIAPRPVLIVHGTADEIVPFYHADGFGMMGGEHVQRVNIEGARHTFPMHRQELISVVHAFLSAWYKT